MTDKKVPAATTPPPKAAGPARPTISADASLVRTVGHLWPYIWPPDRADLKLRVVGALVLLVAAKLVTIAVPYSFKWATDSLSGKALQAPLPTLLAGAIALTIAYGILRSLMAAPHPGARRPVCRGVDECGATACRRGLRPHASAVAALSSRAQDRRPDPRARTRPQRDREIVRLSMLTGVPTVVEFALIIAVVFFQFDWRYAVSVVIMIVAYLGYTTVATNWRIGIRRTMNESDADANTKAIDSLLNYETVKYFGAEEREAQRYDRAMARYEQLSVKQLRLARGAQFRPGDDLHRRPYRDDGDVHCRHPRRHQHVGDFVLINAMMIQLYQPLNFHGHALSRHEAGDHRPRNDVRDSGPRSRYRRSAGCAAAGRFARAGSSSRMCISPMIRSVQILKGDQLRRAGRQDRRHRRSLGRRQIDDLAADLSFL